MHDITFTGVNVEKQISKLNSACSTGPDGIETKCFKEGGDFMIEALIDIYTQMYEEGYSPQCTRDAWINPSRKGKNKMLPENYRPIALTNHI